MQREYHLENSIKQDQAAAAVLKTIASYYYQLKTSHTVIETYLQKIKTQAYKSCLNCYTLSDTVEHQLLECRQ
jgi:hypothetical protein